ncbi:hypothetical protein Tsubulata_009260 [Turnera subulata]|uniref:Uncharacterized protein n=1 Tax=Turnera subulata TaxID=218843 RepID=A0A9Q0JF29_9ROSI|nr:hypothetical protein Tsubulata_009260 [Turnera subulata]
MKVSVDNMQDTDITIHCKSQDDDLRVHVLKRSLRYEWGLALTSGGLLFTSARSKPNGDLVVLGGTGEDERQEKKWVFGFGGSCLHHRDREGWGFGRAVGGELEIGEPVIIGEDRVGRRIRDSLHYFRIDELSGEELIPGGTEESKT